MAQFPSVKASELIGILLRAPLKYEIVRQKGSHRILRSADYPQLLFSYHDGRTVAPGAVRKILVHDVGLDEDTARALL